jgi:hypothetical protein
MPRQARIDAPNALAKKLKLSQLAVNISVKRGEEIARHEKFELLGS